MAFDFGEIVGIVQDFFSNLPDTLNDWYQKSMAYFQSLSLYEMVAWGGNVVGLGLVLTALITW